MIDELSKAIEREAAQRAEVQLLMTHPGGRPLTALAFVLIIGTPERFHCGRQIAGYRWVLARTFPEPRIERLLGIRVRPERPRGLQC